MTVINPSVAAAAGTTAANDTIYDAKGDLVVGTGADTAARLAVGSNTQVLTADSTQATGTKWATPSAATTVANDTLWDTKGDIAAATGADTATKLAVGANDLLLTADSSAATGLSYKASLAARKAALWTPSGLAGAVLVDEPFPRGLFAGTAAVITGGQPRLNGNLMVPKGKTVTKITFYAVAAATVGMTHQWFVLVDLAGNILGITADDTSTAWAATTFKTLALTTPYTASADIGVYAGVCITVSSGNTPTFPVATAQNIGGEVPKFGLNSTPGLTDPASAGSSLLTGAGQGNAGPTWAMLRSD